jgi:hypothetical protein
MHDLGASGLTVWELEPYSKWVPNEKSVEIVISALRRMAMEVEQT